jgi:hypothetical protein
MHLSELYLNPILIIHEDIIGLADFQLVLNSQHFLIFLNDLIFENFEKLKLCENSILGE